MPQSRRVWFRLILFLCGGPIAQSRLERTPDKREVVGSTPTRPTRSASGHSPLANGSRWLPKVKPSVFWGV